MDDVAVGIVPDDVFSFALRPVQKAEKAPTDWREWLSVMFGSYFDRPLAQRHIDFWRHVLSIKLEDSPDPDIEVWPRGGGKSTSLEGAAVALGVRKRRKYAIYVRETQDMADKSVENIRAMFEKPTVERFYPEHARPLFGKYGTSRGWRRNRVRTAGNYTVDALGLDTASRGLKADEDRPDVIFLDDLDGKHDSPAVTQRKIEIITHSILPAGARNVAVIGVQNLIHAHGIFTQLVDGRAEFLVNRAVHGPYPAIEGFAYDWRPDPKTGRRKAFISAGVPTWQGQNLADCQHIIDTSGLSAFIKECQHKVKGKVEGVALRFAEDRHVMDIPHDRRVELCAMGRTFGGVDFGAWRFAFTLWAVDRDGILYRIDEVFSQWESLTQRAQLIHDCCAYYGVEKLIIWGDAANPQDIMELNLAFRAGWDVEVEDEQTGEKSMLHVTSRIRCVKVANENKMRKVAVTRLNDELDANGIRFARLDAYEWRLGMNSGSEGAPQMGSRLIWEVENWSFPVPKAGEAQGENPEDDTADGADMVASMRYAVMSWWSKAKTPKEYPTISSDNAKPFDYKRRQFRDHPHAADEILGDGAMVGRRAPRVNAPRPRTAGR